MKRIYEAIQSQYPDKERAYHMHTLKEELKNLNDHKEESHRTKAKELLEY